MPGAGGAASPQSSAVVPVLSPGQKSLAAALNNGVDKSMELDRTAVEKPEAGTGHSPSDHVEIQRQNDRIKQ